MSSPTPPQGQGTITTPMLDSGQEIDMPLFSAWSVVSALHPSKQTKKQQQCIQHTNFAILQVLHLPQKTFIVKKSTSGSL